MKNYIKSFLITLLSFISVVSFSQKSQYKIKVKINGLADSELILGHYLAGSMIPDDTVRVGKNGTGIFTGNQSLSQGLYFVYLVDKASYFGIIVGEDQNFSVETDTADFIRNFRIKGSRENEVFIGFQQKQIDLQIEHRRLQGQLLDSIDAEQREQIINQINDLKEAREQDIYIIASKNPDLFVTKFIKATLDVKVPEEVREDRNKAYYYYKSHYFDHFDLSDFRLLYTPFFLERVNRYLDKVAVQIADSLIVEVDRLIEYSRSDSTYYQYMVSTLFNKYNKSNYIGVDAILVHISKEYYLKDSWWSSKKFLDDLTKRVSVMEPLLINSKAPDIQLRMVPDEHFRNSESDTALKRFPHSGAFFNISDIDAEFIILAFYDATCGHCKKALPKLHKAYNDTLKSMGVEVVAISTLFGEDGKMDWVDFVNSKGLYGWINAWNPYDYQFKLTYDIRTNPQFYILNSQKEIIMKKLEVEQMPGFIKSYMETKEH